jgi:hypothetical protein
MYLDKEKAHSTLEPQVFSSMGKQFDISSVCPTSRVVAMKMRTLALFDSVLEVQQYKSVRLYLHTDTKFYVEALMFVR